MATDARVVRTQMGLHPGLERPRGWARANFTTERMAEVGLVAAALALAGHLGAVLVRGIRTCSMRVF